MLKSYCDLFFLEDISDSVMKRVGVVVILLLCTITSWGKCALAKIKKPFKIIIKKQFSRVLNVFQD